MGVVALCYTCFTQIPDAVAEQDPFLARNGQGVCKYCGGVTGLVDENAVDDVRKKTRDKLWGE